MIQNEPLSKKLRLITNLYAKVIEMEHYQSEVHYHSDILLAIYHHNSPISQQTLAEHLHIDKPHMTSIIYYLHAEGLIEVEANVIDRSDSFISLTQKGMDDVKSICQVAVEINNQITDSIQPEKLRAFYEVLDELEDSLKKVYKLV